MSQKVKTAYISGPISNMPDFNKQAFNDAAEKIRSLGYSVINPIELDQLDNGQIVSWEKYLARDIPHVCGADLIVVLPGWQKSRGAMFEVYVAKQLKLPILDIETMEPAKEETILEEANRIVNGDRRKAYGSPTKNLGRTAKIWSGILDVDITPEQVALCMIGLKVAREVHKSGRDNACDILGYTLCLDNIIKEKDGLSGTANDQKLTPSV
jgi:hypothetical protein